MKKTSISESLFTRAKAVSPGGVHSPVRAFKKVEGIPRFIESGKGSRIFDEDGNSYVDFCMAWGPLIFGHRDPETFEAVSLALSKGWSFGTAEKTSLELAELITRSIPLVEKVRFVNSGTEAVMSALRVARAATGKDKILKFDGCYHGHSDSLLVKSGSGLLEMASPDSAGVTISVANDTIVLPLGDSEKIDEALTKYKNELACVIVEPLPANNGLLIQKTEWLKHLALRCRETGVLLLFDEVISGFRIGFGGMAERTGIRPDLVTYGKIIGGGFPVGAYGGRKELMDLVAPVGPVYQAGTLSANPVSMAAGLTTLSKLKKNPPYTRLEKLGKLLEDGLKNTPEIELHRFDSLFWVTLPKIKDGYKKLFHALLEDGFYLAPSAFEVGFLSDAHTESEIESLTQAIKSFIRKGDF